MRMLLFLLLSATTLHAQGFGMRDGDTTMTGAALEDRISGQVLTFYDDGKSEFYTDGRYSFTYAGDGGTAYGYWRMEDSGAVCVDFVNGFSRCDLFVMNAGRMLLLDEKGNRYPVRP